MSYKGVAILTWDIATDKLTDASPNPINTARKTGVEKDNDNVMEADDLSYIDNLETQVDDEINKSLEAMEEDEVEAMNILTGMCSTDQAEQVTVLI